RVVDRPALLRLPDDGLDRLLRHAGIVLQLHFGNVGALIQVAHGSHEGDYTANLAVPGAQLLDFLGEIEILSLDTHRHWPPSTAPMRRKRCSMRLEVRATASAGMAHRARNWAAWLPGFWPDFRDDCSTSTCILRRSRANSGPLSMPATISRRSTSDSRRA